MKKALVMSTVIAATTTAMTFAEKNTTKIAKWKNNAKCVIVSDCDDRTQGNFDFAVPLTLVTHVPSDWINATIQHNERPIKAPVHKSVISYNLNPESSSITITKDCYRIFR